MRLILATLPALALVACANQPPPSAAARPYVVYFTQGSAALEPAGSKVVADAAAAQKQAPNSSVLVLGFTDSVGSKPDDVRLSQQRARRVADALTADGVDAAHITQRGRGQTGEEPGVASRRVDIILSN